MLLSLKHHNMHLYNIFQNKCKKQQKKKKIQGYIKRPSDFKLAIIKIEKSHKNSQTF